MRLIDRDVALKALCDTCDGWCECVKCDCINCTSKHRCDAVITFAEQPTIDAVEVVRCKDCEYWMPFIDGRAICRAVPNPNFVSDNHFCSYGERRADNA